MWFKNLRVYRLTKAFSLTAEKLNELLEPHAFVPCGSQDAARYGWVPPLGRHGNQLVHAANGYLMVCAKKQEKVIPAAVVNEKVEELAQAISDKEARQVGRKERQNLKDEVLLEMRPKAFAKSRLQYAYIAPKDGWVVIDAASASAAEELLENLREAISSLAVVPLAAKNLPQQTMTHWLTAPEAPAQFEFGHETELRDPKDSGSVIRCKNQDLCAEEIHNHLVAGLQVHKLGLVWRGGVEFIVDDQLAIKKLKFSDALLEKADSIDSENAAQRFDADFSVMTLEISALLKDLLAAFGGANTESVSVEEVMVRAARAEAERHAAEVEEVAF
ncbi:recombination-associated protein RdgC [Microbulbifer thermotolerans]|uniref:Recombination-associated protein RdgC n=1 Tax=Microbulbifer thermotolerans TaxID=252514 RepID=A0A143HKR3_MICTH|nr:recombination-associated protein RdgC [Microbulbifer thermotolerans]AMX02315.1 recombination-associated protein RdgC [Microbulbifer thermotolerans]MCX2780047.1 recombination-associated protein RdgC [Microbulbifer thermotolerans]MCX2781756.1 recombination-associated protein RdgC [Microbulbifer thermotolerans]MCX2795097.1 recombination-associated protein RdgC [Microbulbifer thermotolerans]MCX2801874.1 recombination-associated protein RdgC [Microbulbifer thermotolerans]